jgi:cell division protein FtsL
MAVAAPRARPAPRPEAAEHALPFARRSRSRPAPRPRLARGVAGIALVAALLAGIVALQVAVLELRMERGRVQSELVEIGAQNARIESEISTAASVSRVEGAARGRLGLVEPSSTTYVELPASAGR